MIIFKNIRLQVPVKMVVLFHLETLEPVKLDVHVILLC
jgi:hypothetical protein